MSAFNPVYIDNRKQNAFQCAVISTTVCKSCMIQMDEDIFTCEKYRLGIKEVGGYHTQ